jgi:hypothetical protein
LANPTISWIAANTSPRSVFISNQQRSFDPVMLSGRRSFWGVKGTLLVRGPRVQERRKALSALSKLKDRTQIKESLRRLGVDYVLFYRKPKHPMFPLNLNYNLLSKACRVVYKSADSSIEILAVSKS